MRGITARSIPHIPLRHSLGREGGRRVILLLPKKPFAAQLGPSPNDGHAHVGGMDWLSKIFGAENFWMAILLIPIKNGSAARSAPNPNDGHARCGGMGWLSKIFGTEILWMATRLTPIKIDRLQDWPKPEGWSCPWRWHGLLIKTFRDRNFWVGDSVASYKN